MKTVARNADYTKKYNRTQILKLLRYHPMSRAEIARKMGLTRASTSLIIADLLSEGLVYEMEPVASLRGRTPTPLTLSNNASYAVGIYINRDGCTAGVADVGGNLLMQEHIRLGDEPEKLESLCRAIIEMMQRTKIPIEKFCGIGISAPGPLDGESGRILNPTRFDLWHQTYIAPVLRERVGLSAFLENNASCLASYHYGRPESKSSENFMLLLVDSGIGSGIISRGKVFKGAGSFTGELGHTSIQYQGRPCACGNLGCLEEYAAIPKLLKGSSFSTWKQVIDGQKISDEAQKLLTQEVEYLSAGIVTMTNLIPIDTVLLAGDLLYGVEHIAPLIQRNVNLRWLRREQHAISVVPSSNAPGIRILSAADIAFNRAFSV